MLLKRQALLAATLGLLWAGPSGASEPLKESYLRSSDSSWQINLERARFSQKLDLIGYLDSLEGASRPEKYSQSAFSLAYKFGTWHPFIEFREVSGSVERSLQPFEVESNADYWGVGLAYSTGIVRKRTFGNRNGRCPS